LSRSLNSPILLMAGVLARGKRSTEGANHATSCGLANLVRGLRIPLETIISFCDIIRDRTFGTTERHSEYAPNGVASRRPLFKLMNGMSDSPEIEPGMMTSEEFPVGPLLASCVSTMQVLASDKRLDLLLDDRTGGCSVHGDEAAIRQIVLSLLCNAIKFTASGWVYLAARTEESRLLIEVSDTGCGIPKHVQPHVFVSSGRADTTFSPSPRGTGHGLVLVQNLAKAHGGNCHVESTPGEGATFRIVMPIVSSEGMMVAA
jgi:signal transduction histidine kinase